MLLFLSLISYFQKQIRYYNAVAELNRMSDYELQDIGISRGDIETICKYME